jgi:hypothetical protein
MNTFRDEAAKARCEADCEKRNKNILKTHPMRWKPLWNEERGWHAALRPKLERVVVERKSYGKPR